MHGNRLALGSLLALALGTPSLARGDRIEGTKSASMYERKHEIVATLHRGWAELRVRRSVENEGTHHDQAMIWLDVPAGGVATSLATLGSLAGRPHWWSGELMEAEAAAAKYRELTGLGGWYPKDPALLSWRSQNELLLQVFPVPPGEAKTVEYTLLVPTTYGGGSHHIELPGLGTPDLVARVTLRAGEHGDTLEIGGRAARAGATLTPKLGATVEIGAVPDMRDPLGGELAVASAGSRHVVSHFAFEAAPKVSRVPKGAYVVVAIDASRSVSDELLAAELSAVRAYLGHFKDAEVELCPFDRELHRHYGRFVGVSRAVGDLAGMHVETHNGSAVDLALGRAQKILDGAPKGHPRRLVLVTDGLVRSSLKPERIRAALGADAALTHIGIMSVDSPSLARNDEHPWSEATRATGGLVWTASANGDRAALARVYEEWARPLRIDHVELYSPDVELGSLANLERPTTLDEGEGFAHTFVSNRSPTWIRMEGELWAEHVERVVHADTDAGKRWSALVFGTDLYSQLDEVEQMTLARRGGAVSPVTSYLAIEPGVRPSTEGLDWGRLFGAHATSSPRVRAGATSVNGATRPFDPEAWLARELGAAWRACGGTAGAGHVNFETTYAEVVDVTAVVPGPTTDPLLEGCLREAVWALAPPVEFRQEWTVWSLDV